MSLETRIKSIRFPRIKVLGAVSERFIWIISMSSQDLINCNKEGSVFDICWFDLMAEYWNFFNIYILDNPKNR